MTEAPQGPAMQPASVSMDDPLDATEMLMTGGHIETLGVDEGDDEAPDGLDPSWGDDFSGLLRLGYLEEEIEVVGHQFRIHTPDHETRYQRGVLHKPAVGTMNFETQWELLTVAAYVTEIDGQHPPEPLGSNDTKLSDRVAWIKRTIYSPLVIRLIFNQTLELDARERKIVEYLDGQIKA